MNLMPVPIAPAETDGTLRGGTKSLLVDAMTSNTKCPPNIKLEGTSCLIIDGHALIQAIGRPAGTKTFGELADIFVCSVMQSRFHSGRIDIVFDRYYSTSIKSNTRKKRSKSSRPIRKVVNDESVPLPINWENFIALVENKADLAWFLSMKIMQNAPDNKCIVVAGGYEDEEEVECSDKTKELDSLRAKHEEADTRIVLHCLHTDADTIVVSARDTDVFVLVAHFHKFNCSFLWLKAGTSNEPKYIPIHTVCSDLLRGPTFSQALLTFHALTGCGTTSFLAGHSKKTAWKVFKEQYELLVDLGNGELDDDKIKSAEQFVCRIYDITEEGDVNKARVILLTGSRSIQALLPTSNALRFHIQRAHHQASVWRQAHCTHPNVPEPTMHG